MTTPRKQPTTRRRTSPTATTRSSSAPALEPSERQFQKAVVETAERAGWLVFHVADSRKIVHRNGTPIAVPDPEAAGFPDLVLCHPERGRIVFAELKKRTGKTSAKQEAWIAALAAAGEQVYVWRPAHWDHIEKVLTGR